MAKFVMHQGRIAVQEDDGTIRPLTTAEVKNMRTQMGRDASHKSRKKNNAG